MRTTKQQQQAREQRLKELLAVDGVVLASVSTGYIGDYNNQEAEEVVRNLDIEEMRKTTTKKTKQESKQATKQQAGKTIDEQIIEISRWSKGRNADINVELLEAKDSKSGEVYVLKLNTELRYLKYKDDKINFYPSVEGVSISRKKFNNVYNVEKSLENTEMPIFKNLPREDSIAIAEGDDLEAVLTKYIDEKLKNDAHIIEFFDGLLNNFLENIKDIPPYLANKDIEGTDAIVKNVTARKIVKNDIKNFGGDDVCLEIETVKDWRGINQTIGKIYISKFNSPEYKTTIIEDNKKGTTDKDLKIAINNLKNDVIALLNRREFYNIMKTNNNAEKFKKCEKMHKYQAEESKQAEETKKDNRATKKQQATKTKQQAEAKREAEAKRQAEAEAKRQEEEAKREAEAKRQAEAEAKRQEEEAKRQAEQTAEPEKMEEMMALVQELTEQNKKAIEKIEQLEEKIEENKPFLKKIGDKVKKIKASAVEKVKEVKDATVAKVKEVKDATVAKVKEVTVEAVVAVIPQAVKEEIKKQGIQEKQEQKQEQKQGNQEKQEPKQGNQEKQEPKQEGKVDEETSRIDAKVQNIEKARIKKIFRDQGDEVALFFNLKTLYRVQTVGGKVYNIKKDSTADAIAEMIKAS